MRSAQLFGAAALALASVVGLSAQSATTERKEKTKIEVKGGKDVTINGCLERSEGSTPFILTDAIGDLRYAVVSEEDLSKYIGRRVEIKGKAADRGDAKVKIEQKVEGTTGETTEAKIEKKGDATLMPYLGLRSIKAIGGSCQ